MVDHEWRVCEICSCFYCSVCTNNKENLPKTCYACDEEKESYLRFHFFPLIKRVLLSEDPLCLSNFEDFELYNSRVFEHHPEMLYHPVLNELYTYLRQKFE